VFKIKVISYSVYKMVTHVRLYGDCICTCCWILAMNLSIIYVTSPYLFFLISNFHRVLNVVFFNFGLFPASEFYVATFRNTVSHTQCFITAYETSPPASSVRQCLTKLKWTEGAGVEVLLTIIKYRVYLMFIGPCIILIIEERETNMMSLALLFHYLMLNMFRMLMHPSSGACNLCVELFHGLYWSGSMWVGVRLWFGCGGVVSVCRLRH